MPNALRKRSAGTRSVSARPVLNTWACQTLSPLRGVATLERAKKMPAWQPPRAMAMLGEALLLRGRLICELES